MARSRRPWSDLPIEIVELIANRIDNFCGYIRFGTVCKSWRCVTLNSRQLQALQPPPWLVIHFVDCTKIVCFMDEDHLQLYPVETLLRGNSTRCFGSSFGWLMMTNYPDGNNYLLNPCNHQKIRLPRSRPKADDFFRKAVLTTSPHNNPIININSSGGCGGGGVNIGVLAISYHFQLSFCILGGEEEEEEHYNWCRLGECMLEDGEHWCILGDEKGWFVDFHSDRIVYADIILFRGLLHGLTINHQIVIFEFDQFGAHHHHHHHQAGGYLQSRPLGTRMERVRFRSGCDDERLHLVESAGEVLMVIRSWVLVDHPAPERNVDHDYDDVYMKTVHFGVYMLVDYSSLLPRWVRLTSLGGARALLVGEAGSISVDATKFSWFRIKPDCIYFTDGNADEYEWREFCLKDNHHDQKITKFSSSNVAKIIAN